MLISKCYVSIATLQITPSDQSCQRKPPASEQQNIAVSKTFATLRLRATYFVLSTFRFSDRFS